MFEAKPASPDVTIPLAIDNLAKQYDVVEIGSDQTSWLQLLTEPE